MTNVTKSVLTVAVLVSVGAAGQARADFLYTFQFDEATTRINNVWYDYAAAEFSLVSQTLVTAGQSVTVQTPGDLNGFLRLGRRCG